MHTWLRFGVGVWLIGATALSFAQTNEGLRAEAVDHFREALSHNLRNSDAYDSFVADLEKAGAFQERHPDAFLQFIDRDVLKPDQYESYHYLGLALYSRGYDEEAMLVLERFQKHASTPAESMEKIEKIIDQSAPLLPPDTARKIEAQVERAKAAAANEYHDRLKLKNGQSVEGRIVSQEESGVWIEMGKGAEVFYAQGEIAEVVAGHETKTEEGA